MRPCPVQLHGEELQRPRSELGWAAMLPPFQEQEEGKKGEGENRLRGWEKVGGRWEDVALAASKGRQQSQWAHRPRSVAA
jgi:hypothetical protein